MSLIRQHSKRRWALIALTGMLIIAAAVVAVAKYRATSSRLNAPVLAQADENAPQSLPGTRSQPCRPTTTGPTTAHREFIGTTTKLPVTYGISFPKNYYTSCQEYPVIYTLHGRDQSSSSFINDAMAIRQAMDDGVLDQAIIVTPDSYRDGRWEDRGAHPAETHVIKELIPFVEQHYRVKKGPAFRLLTGFSMGGHGAFRLAVKYPTMFAATLVVDGAMTPDDNAYLQYLPGVRAHHPPIHALGGKLCGQRVAKVIQAFKNAGITIPYTYRDLNHDYQLFISTDRDKGWPDVKFLQQHLGKPVS